ncbi:MAG TPA: glycine zipper 2TM domain-containing protein [Azospira sp.]|nr:glycine zipper 2TM domain-containing protein [Azospira sp.]
MSLHTSTPVPQESAPRRLHPLAAAAAVSVTVFSLLGVGAITGIIPTAHSEKNEVAAADASQTSRTASAKAPVEAPLASAGTSGSAAAPASGHTASSGKRAAICANCGVVEAVRSVQVEGNASGLGAVAGGVTGAIVGNQFGRGGGNTAMTLLGAAGGAFAGNSIEKNMHRQTVYRITVRMDDGSFRTISQSHVPSVADGDKVKVVNGSVSAIP